MMIPDSKVPLSPISIKGETPAVERDLDFTTRYRAAYDQLIDRETSATDFQSKQSRSPQSLDVWTAAFENHNSLSSAIVREPMPDVEPVIGYDPYVAGDTGKTDIDGYEQYWESFVESSSPQETAVIKQNIDRELRNQQILAEGGIEGVVASVAAGIVDPLNLATAFIPGVGQTNLVRAGTSAVAGATITEAALQSTQETRTAEETAINVAASAIFSGLVVGVADSAKGLVKNGQTDLLRQEVSKSLSAAERVSPGIATGAEITKGPLSYVGRQMAKITPLGRTLQSDESAVRATVQELIETNIGLEGGLTPTAVESLIKLDYAKMSQAEVKVRNLEKQWIKANGADRLAFSTELTNAMRTGDIHADPLVQQAIDTLRQGIDDLWQRAAKAKIPGTFEVIKGEDGAEQIIPLKTNTADSYLTRRYDLNQVRNDPEGHKRSWVEGLKDQHQREFAEQQREFEEQLAKAKEEYQIKAEEVGKKFDETIAKDLKKAEPDVPAPRNFKQEADELQSEIDEIIDDPFNYGETGDLKRQFQVKLDRLMDRQSALEVDVSAAAKVEPTLAQRAADDPKDFEAARQAYIERKIGKFKEPEPPTMKDLDDNELWEIASDIHNKIINLREGDLHFNTGPGGATAMKQRANVRDEYLNNYLIKDWEELINGYYKSMAPRVRLAERFGESEGGFTLKNQLDAIGAKYEARISSLDKEMAAAKTPAKKKEAQSKRDKLTKQYQADVRDIEVMRDRLLNISQEASWMNPENRGALSALRTARSWNVATMLSNVVVASVPDMARLLTYNGTGRMMKAFARSAFTKNLKRSNLPKDDMARIASAMDRASTYRLGHLTEVEDGIVYTRADKYAHYVANKVMGLSGIKHWNSTLKTVAGHLVGDKIGEHLAKGTGRESLRRLGLTDSMYDAARREARRYASKEDGLWSLNVDRWASLELVEAIEAAAIKEADNLIVTPGAGDKALLMTTEVGRTLFQFKSFMVASTNRMLLPLLQEKGIRPWLEISTHVGLGAGIYALRQTIVDRELPEDPSEFMIHAVESTGLPGYALELMKANQAVTGVDMLGLEQDAKYYARGPWGTLLGPSAQTAQNVWRAGYGLMPGLVGNEVDGATTAESRAKAIRKLLPMQNHYVLKHGYDKIEEGVAKSLGATNSGVKL